MSRAALDVWLYGTRTATVAEDRDGRLALTWTEDARHRWGDGARLLSAKLAIGARPSAPLVKNYLDGLLPEGNARVNRALDAGVSPDDTFGLVRQYGRDTPGAAILVPTGAGDPTGAGHYQRLTEAEVAERLRQADEHSPADQAGDAESSTLPGMVPKITVHRDELGWLACKDGAPSTWIIKRAAPRDSELGDVVDTEVACLALARLVGLTSIDAEVIEYGDVRAIAVSRYDRVPEEGGIGRIHQEDLAQATGLDTRDPNRKFQWGSVMPSLADGATVLRKDGGNPDELLRLATFSILVGNTDMHAKNVSFIRRPDAGVGLAPAYDVAMHLHHARDNRRFALDVNGKFDVSLVTVDDLVAEGVAWGLPQRRARNVVDSTARALSRALAEIDRSDHPGVPDRAWEIVESRTYDAAGTVEADADVEAAPSRRRGPRRPR